MYRLPAGPTDPRPPWRGTLLALVAFAVPATLVAAGPLPALARLDAAVSAAIRTVASPALDTLALATTLFGDSVLTVPLMVALVALLLVAGRWALALHAAWLFVLAKLVVAVTKVTLARARPLALYEGGDGYSFPSGHATSSTVLLGVVCALLLARHRHGVRRAAIVVAFAVPAVLVALSRVRLGAHWPSDVAAGLALGTALVLPFAWHAERAIAAGGGQGAGWAALRPAALPWLALALLSGGYPLHAAVAWRGEAARYAAAREASPQDASPHSSESRLSRPQAVR